MFGLQPATCGRHASWCKVLAYASALSLLLMAGTLYPAVHELMTGYGGHKVFGSIFNTASMVAPMIWPVTGYAAAVIGLHLCLGMVATGLAYLTMVAFPALNATRQSLLVLWFIVLSVVLIACSAAIYPRSLLGDYYHAVVTLRLGSLQFYQVLILLVIGLVLVVGTRAALRSRRVVLHSRVWAPVAFAMLIVFVFLLWPGGGLGSSPRSFSNPHVVIIGIDSLRTDVLARFGGRAALPRLNAELTDAHLWRDTISPLARTFPAWVSILTGNHPRTTGAIFNLVARDQVHSYPTLADILRSKGYATVFAMDEVRFANIDHSYGFDQIVAPEIGASDFVLGTLNDLPLTNLVANTRLGGWLFPHTHANRAAATRYMPDVFVERLRREVRFEKPTLLIAHLTMPHWPYHHATKHVGAEESKKRSAYEEYLSGVEVADRQLDGILDFLREQGVLDNAIVWFLSDHGEALSQPGDKLIRQPNIKSSSAQIPVTGFGHGTSVLSPVQFQVLLAVKGYGKFASRVQPGDSTAPASLEDLTPTTLDWIGMTDLAARKFDGRSLLPLLPGEPAAAQALHERIRFTETDFNMPRLLAGDVNPGWLAMNAVDYYTVNGSSGWVELKPERLSEMRRLKERAAISGDSILAALPTASEASLYVFVRRATGAFMVLDHTPSESDGEQWRLWTALHERFPNELGAPQPSPERTATVQRGMVGVTQRE